MESVSVGPVHGGVRRRRVWGACGDGASGVPVGVRGRLGRCASPGPGGVRARPAVGAGLPVRRDPSAGRTGDAGRRRDRCRGRPGRMGTGAGAAGRRARRGRDRRRRRRHGRAHAICTRTTAAGSSTGPVRRCSPTPGTWSRRSRSRRCARSRTGRSGRTPSSRSLAAGLLDEVDGRVVADAPASPWSRRRVTRSVTSRSLVTAGDDEVIVTGDVLVHAVQLANPDVAYRSESDQSVAADTRRAVARRTREARGALLATAHLHTGFVGRLAPAGTRSGSRRMRPGRARWRGSPS